MSVTPIGRSSIHSVSFYIMGSDDVVKESCGVTTNKNLFLEGVPVANGLYDPHYGTTELGQRCHTCLNDKIECPGHDGSNEPNYPVQNAVFRKEIIKWIKITCPKCKNFNSKKELPDGYSNEAKLGEYVKLIRTSAEKYKKCAHCGEMQPWIFKDPTRNGILWKEYPKDLGAAKGKVGEVDREIIYNHEIMEWLSGISDENVIKMGKKLNSHPKKLILQVFKIPTVVIRPEIRKIGGSRSSMSDTTAHLRNIMEYSSQIPQEIPKGNNVDTDLMTKLVLIDLTFYDMIMGSGSGGNQSTLKLLTNTNKVSNSLANRLPKKSGRLRSNLMGKRTTKMMRSVITGDKALRPDQVGVPKMIARSQFVPVTVRPWNRKECMTYFTNGTKNYPGCNKIVRQDTGKEHYIDKLPKDYTLKDGDVIYRQCKDGDKKLWAVAHKLSPTGGCCLRCIASQAGKQCKQY